MKNRAQKAARWIVGVGLGTPVTVTIYSLGIRDLHDREPGVSSRLDAAFGASLPDQHGALESRCYEGVFIKHLQAADSLTGVDQTNHLP